jgi:hypothetical protein
MDLGHNDAALLALTKANALNPTSAITLIALAGVHLESGAR